MNKFMAAATVAAITLGATQADAGGCRTRDVAGWWKLFGMATTQEDNGDTLPFTELWNCAIRFGRAGDVTYLECHAPAKDTLGDYVIIPNGEPASNFLEWSQVRVALGCAVSFDIEGGYTEETRKLRGQLSSDKQVISGIGSAPSSDWPTQLHFTMVRR